MTAGDTMQHRPSGELIRKLSSEMRPPAICPRDERIRSVNSFEEIIESEEEENQLEQSCSSHSDRRSPYAVLAESPFSQRRSNSLNHNALVSPKFARRLFSTRLHRGFSDPIVRRKNSFPLMSTGIASPDRLFGGDNQDLLSLPPIPEAATPSSPSTSSICPTLRKDRSSVEECIREESEEP